MRQSVSKDYFSLVEINLSTIIVRLLDMYVLFDICYCKKGLNHGVWASSA
jgi:hypothetical protein